MKTSQKTVMTSVILTGTILAICSNALFGVLYMYGKWLAPLSGTDVFLWRMLMMWLCLMGFLLLSGKIKTVMDDLANIKTLGSWCLLLLPTPIFASQLWLFMYAPLNGLGIQVSMGYFLFPLVMVIVGFLLGEYLSRLQWLAILIAGIGVMVEVFQAGEIGWATFWVCGTYPIYYILRRKQKIRALTGLFVDTSLIAPFCLFFLLYQSQNIWGLFDDGLFWLKVAGLGLISVLALQSNLEANRLLPTSLFGVLSYLEPAFLFVIAVLFLHESFHPTMLLSFGLIWLGVILLLFANFTAQNKHKQNSTTKT